MAWTIAGYAAAVLCVAMAAAVLIAGLAAARALQACAAAAKTLEAEAAKTLRQHRRLAARAAEAAELCLAAARSASRLAEGGRALMAAAARSAEAGAELLDSWSDRLTRWTRDSGGRREDDGDAEAAEPAGWLSRLGGLAAAAGRCMGTAGGTPPDADGRQGVVSAPGGEDRDE
ncbi:hypothetical protein [Cohnella sp. 56]|uniref:hypothetical protein n=1 Tax=Cohnella sp. 56 TaxID=3113722 RepID=UPI0030E9C596